MSSLSGLTAQASSIGGCSNCCGQIAALNSRITALEGNGTAQTALQKAGEALSKAGIAKAQADTLTGEVGILQNGYAELLALAGSAFALAKGVQLGLAALGPVIAGIQATILGFGATLAGLSAIVPALVVGVASLGALVLSLAAVQTLAQSAYNLADTALKIASSAGDQAATGVLRANDALAAAANALSKAIAAQNSASSAETKAIAAGNAAGAADNKAVAAGNAAGAADNKAVAAGNAAGAADNKAVAAGNAANTADKKAVAAAGAAGVADNKAVAAGNAAETANDKAEEGIGIATSAIGVATSAIGVATSATEVATSAIGVATSAKEVATSAIGVATSAIGIGGIANNKATTAEAKATEALDKAKTALDKALTNNPAPPIIYPIQQAQQVTPSKENEILDLLKSAKADVLGIPGALAKNPDYRAAAISAAAAGACQSSQPGKCPGGGADQSKKLGDLMSGLSAATGVLNNQILLPMSNTVNAINTKLGAQITGGLGKWVTNIADLANKSQVLNVLNYIATLHNAYFLSNALTQTLFSAVGNSLAALGLKDTSQDPAGQPLNIGKVVGDYTEGFFKTVFGVATVNGIKSDWKKYSRIYQAAAQVLSSLQSIGHSILGALEVVGSHVGKIGNALQKFRVVSERAYAWMNPQPSFQNRFLTGLQTAQTVVSQVDQVASETLSIQQQVTEIQKNTTELQNTLKQKPDSLQATPTPEAEDVKKAAATEKAASKSPAIPETAIIKPD